MKAHQKEIMMASTVGVISTLGMAGLVVVTALSARAIATDEASDTVFFSTWLVGSMVSVLLLWATWWIANDVRLTVKAIRSDYIRRNHPTARNLPM
jgi:hypothetical protein